MLFDLDDTLLDYAPYLANAANVLRGRRGFAPLPVEVLRLFVAQGARGMITQGLQVSVDHPDYEAL